MEIVLSYVANEMMRLSESHVNILKDMAPSISQKAFWMLLASGRLCLTLLQSNRSVNSHINCLVIRKHV